MEHPIKLVDVLKKPGDPGILDPSNPGHMRTKTFKSQTEVADFRRKRGF